MKYSIASLLFLLTTLNTHAESKVKLHGKIIHPIADTISVKFNVERVAYNLQTVTAKVKGDGTFDLSFRLTDRFTKLYIVHGQQTTEIFVAPGYDLDMHVDAQHFDSSLHFTGNGSTEANFCALHSLKYGSSGGIESAAQVASRKGVRFFERDVDSLLHDEMDFLKNNNKGLGGSFVKYWEALYSYAVYNSMLYFPVYHQMFIQQSMSIRDIPKEDYTPVNDVPEVFDDNLLDLANYRTYLDRLYSQRLAASGVVNLRDSAGMHYMLNDSVLKVAYARMPPQTAEMYAAKCIYDHSKSYPIQKSAENLDEYRLHFPKGAYLPVLTQALEQIKLTSEGSPAMDFTLRAIDGKTVKLSDFRGKVVMIDFWASWCVPCMGEMPYTNKIAAYYKGKDVVFLFVSIDDDEANWKNAVEKCKIEGLNLRDAGRYGGTVAKQYRVEAVPEHFLVDKQGNFGVRPAPNPRDEVRLKAAIDRLLQ